MARDPREPCERLGHYDHLKVRLSSCRYLMSGGLVINIEMLADECL